MRTDPALAGRPVAVRERVGSRELVRAASPPARAEGVVPGLRRREAEARCPGLVVVDADPRAEAVAFEHVARAVEALTPRVEVVRPGLLAFPTLGPARYFGGDEALAARLHAAVAPVAGVDGRVGVADGGFAARLAARRATGHPAVLVVPPGGSPGFLAPFPVAALGDPELAGLLVRLGLPTLGAFADLPAASVLARFGPDGLRRHALARGIDPDPVDLVEPPPDLVEVLELDPPATRVDQVAFAAKALADRLLARLGALGLGCTRVVVEAETEHGERRARRWRHEGALTPAALAERVRWQLDAWLTADAAVGVRTPHDDPDPRARQDAAALAEAGCDATTGALARLRLVPDGVVRASGRQLGFWGGDQAATDRAARALARVQGMLGHEAVVTAVAQGGRTPAERVRWVPWGEPREPARPRGPVAGPVGREVPRWPGAVPGPAPARVHDPPAAAELVDAAGTPVAVSGRGEASGAPAALRCPALPGGGGVVTGWAGPWLHDVRWWDPHDRHRRALYQMTVATGAGAPEVACLVVLEGGRAALAAVHD